MVVGSVSGHGVFRWSCCCATEAVLFGISYKTAMVVEFMAVEPRLWWSRCVHGHRATAMVVALRSWLSSHGYGGRAAFMAMSGQGLVSLHNDEAAANREPAIGVPQ